MGSETTERATRVDRPTCCVCGATEHDPFDAPDHREIVRCRACGYLFAVRLDTAVLEETYKKNYYASSDDPRMAEWVEQNAGVWGGIRASVEACQAEVSSLLDVGAGTGGFLEEWHRHHPGTRLAAVESSPHARESLSRQFSELTLLAEDADRLDGPDQVAGSYSVVTVLQVLEHVKDPAALCRAIHRLLEPGGLLLVTVPNVGSYRVRLKGRRETLCFGDPTHLQFFSRHSLLALLRGAGFSRMRRLVELGGSNVTSRPLQLVQYGLRRMCLSTELRVAAWKDAAEGAGGAPC